MKTKIGVGIIGASPGRGWAAAAHVPALAAVPDYELRAVSTTRRETALAAKTAFAIPFAFDNADELIAHPDVDLVVVSVKTPLHNDLVRAALHAGKHVYCEWPLGNGLGETIALAALAREKNVKTAIGLQGRVSPWVNYVRALIADGFVGRVLSSTFVASDEFSSGNVDKANVYMLDKTNGATPLTIHGGHFGDTLCYVLGEFASVSAATATSRPEVMVNETGESVLSTAPDQIALSGTLESGAVVSFHLRAGSYPGPGLHWEIQGTDGFLRITSEGFVHWAALTVEGAQGNEPFRVLDPPPTSEFFLPATLGEGPQHNVAYLYHAFARMILEGAPSCADFDHAVLRHRLVDAIQTAAKNGTFFPD